jgi:hypothetical protein
VAVTRRSKGLLWLLFTSATLLGWAIGLPLAVWLNEIIFEAIARGSATDINVWLLSALNGVITGAAVGLASGLLQWLALRLYGLRSGAWALVSTLGWAIGFGIAVPLSTWLAEQLLANGGIGDSPLLLGLVIAAILGIAGGLFSGTFQFPALGGQARRAGLWPITNLAIWTLTFCGIALVMAVFSNAGVSVFSWAGDAPLNHIVTGVTIGAVGGTLSGAALTGVV